MRPSGFWLEATAICSSQTPQSRSIFAKRELRRYKRSALTNISPLGHHKVVGDEQAVLFFFSFFFFLSRVGTHRAAA